MLTEDFYHQELLDTLSKRLKEKSLMYSQDEFKDITDIVKVLLDFGYCSVECMYYSNLPAEMLSVVYALVFTNFWDTTFQTVELGLFLSVVHF